MARRTVKTSVALDGSTIEWLDLKVKRKDFASRSHGIEFCIQRVREEERSERPRRGTPGNQHTDL